MKKNKLNNTTQSEEELLKTQKESELQVLPEQKTVFSISGKIRKRVHNLPDPARPPLGYDPKKAFDAVFPYIRLPFLHPSHDEDTVEFGSPKLEPNILYFGDNLNVLRNMKTESVDLIYIDPPFFSGRVYNRIWGDSNEVRAFYDIWEGGIDTYLIWLNARLWEMKRILKKTGSIYVHLDWHASHYAKCEMDKIFGYDNFANEIVWAYRTGGATKDRFGRKHDIILYYSKSPERIFHAEPEKSIQSHKYGYKNVPYYIDSETGQQYRYTIPRDVWELTMGTGTSERIGYPTQKPEGLLEKIIKASSNEGDIVADFFCGGGTTLAVAQKLSRRWIGCDISRVAIAVTIDRLVKIGEELSGVTSNISKQKEFQHTFVVNKPVPNICIYYLGVYPMEKFKYVSQEDFETFILTCFGASKNTGTDKITGFKTVFEPILVGPADPEKAIEAEAIKEFFQDVLKRLKPNVITTARICAWKFSPQVNEYLKVLRRYIIENDLPMELEYVPLNSELFRERVLKHYPSVEENEFFLKFTSRPIIGEIKFKNIGPEKYKFEALDAYSTNRDGYLINCQWDFDYQAGHFDADRSYILGRKEAKDGFEAVLSAEKEFERNGKFIVACRVQDNLGGEAIKTVMIEVKD
jgi:DNA modification methylase